jgi:hypothetical protein
MRPLSFCTVMDRNYLTRGLALYTSLRRHCPSFDLFVLCMDRATFDTLQGLTLHGMKPVPFDDVADEALLQASKGRTMKELSATCKSFFALWLLRRHPAIECLSFLDGDLFFFSNPAALLDHMEGASVAMTENRFPARLEPDSSRDYGVFNSGWVCFRRDARGLACLADWCGRCLEWCFDRVEDGKYGDQKYLEDWPRRFDGIVVLKHKGANLAPWNVEDYSVSRRQGLVLVDGDPVIFYHFSGLRQVRPWLYQSGLELPAKGALRRWVYRPYLRTLARWEKQVGRHREPDCGFQTAADGYSDIARHLWSGRMLWKAPMHLW